MNPKYLNAYFGRGCIYIRQKKYKKALDDFNSILYINPNNSHVYNSIGFVYALKKEYKNALTQYDRAIQIDSLDAMAYSNRCVYFNEIEHDGKRALNDCLKAIALEKRGNLLKDYYFNLCTVYYELGRYGDVITASNKCLELDINYKEAYQYRSFAYAKLEKFDLAEQDFQFSKKLKKSKKFEIIDAF